MRSALTLLGVLLRDALRHPLQAAVSVLGVALGLSVVVAVHASGRASRDSFARTFEAVAGRATHQLIGTRGLEPEAMTRALAHPGVVAAQPIIEGSLPVIGWDGRDVATKSSDSPLQSVASGEPPLRLLGIDPFSVAPFLSIGGERPAERTPQERAGRDPLAHREALVAFLTKPGAILAPDSWASARSLHVGSTVDVVSSGMRKTLTIVGLLPASAFPDATDAIAVADVATADEVLGRGGRIDRIDLIVEEGAAIDDLAREGETIERPAQRGERAASLTDAFRLNLLALSTLALLVGCYLVFNSAQFAVVRREALLGQLRCLGATRGALLLAVVLEVALLGALGGAIGLFGGTLLSRVLVGGVARTVSTLYGFVRVESTRTTPAEQLAFFAMAVGVAIIAGFLPARDAAATPPRMVGSRSLREAAFGRRVPQLLAVALGGALLAVVALAWPTRAHEAGFLAAFGILIAGGALVPPAMALVLPRLRGLAERRGGITSALALGDVERSLSRTGIATSALSVSLAMAVGVMVMIHSFEQEVRAWISSALVADLYVAPFRQDQSVEDARVPQGAIDVAQGMPFVKRIDRLRGRDAVFRGKLIRVLGMDSPGGLALTGRTFLHGDKSGAWDRMKAGDAVISEPMSERFGLKVGDVVELPSANGTLRATVTGVVRDYALDRGYVLLSSGTYVDAFGDEGVNNVAITLVPGTDAHDAARRLREAWGRAGFLMEIVASSALKDEVGVAFEQTFAVTRVLQALATGLALAGIATALASLFLERLREVATLRAIGAPLWRIAGLFLGQGFVLASVAALAALPVGAVLSWLLVDVVNLRSFGWSIRMSWPLLDLLRLIGLALASGLLASLVPWMLAWRSEIASALREE